MGHVGQTTQPQVRSSFLQKLRAKLILDFLDLRNREACSLLATLDQSSVNTYTCIVESVSKPVRWVGSSWRDLKAFPKPVQRDVGQALYAAQCGEEYPAVKALKGFGGRTVLEIIAPYERDTFRAVYTVRFDGAVYVLHAFQKKSKKGIATPQKEIELVKQRLAAAEQNYRERHN